MPSDGIDDLKNRSKQAVEQINASSVKARQDPKLVGVVLVLSSAIVLTLGEILQGFSNDQSWGGDWAQYLLHADNLTSRNDYQEGLSQFPAAPLSFTILLAAVSLSGLPTLLAAQLMNFGFLAGIAVLSFRSVLNTTNVAFALLAVIFTISQPTLQALTYQIGPELGFAFFTLGTLTLAPGSKLQTTFLIIACSFRIEALILPLVLLFQSEVPPGVKTRQLFAGFLSSFVTLYGLAVVFGTGAYGSSDSSTRKAVGALLRPSAALDNAREVSLALQDFSETWWAVLFGLKSVDAPLWSVAGLLLVVSGLIFVSNNKNSVARIAIIGLFIFFGAVAIVFRIGSEGPFPGRYLAVILVLLPTAVASMISKHKLLLTGRNSLTAFLAALLVFVSYFPIQNQTREWYEATDFSESISAVDDADTLGFFKPRTLQYAVRTDYDGGWTPEIISLRNRSGVQQIKDAGGCAVVELVTNYGQEDVRRELQELEEQALATLVYKSEWRETYCFG
jgi:hypothetical protein